MNPNSPLLCRRLLGLAAPILQPSFAHGSSQSAAALEALLLPQPTLRLRASAHHWPHPEPTEMARVPVGNILSVCPNHDNARHHPVRLFWASLPPKLGVQCQGDMPSRTDIMPAPPVGSPESGGWLQSLQANLLLSL